MPTPTRRRTKTAVAKPEPRKFTIVKDTREKEGHGFSFKASKYCLGMKRAALKTGDYTIVGLEDVVCVERKESIGEFAGNISGPDRARFERELKRMETFKACYVVLQFEFEDLIRWPASSGLSKYRQAYIKTTGSYLLKRLCEIQAAHPWVRFLFAGAHSQQLTLALLKQGWADYQHLVPAA